MDLARNYVCVKVDSSDDEAVASVLGVRGLPTLQIRDSSGKKLYEHVGYLTAEELQKPLEEHRPK